MTLFSSSLSTCRLRISLGLKPLNMDAPNAADEERRRVQEKREKEEREERAQAFLAKQKECVELGYGGQSRGRTHVHTWAETHAATFSGCNTCTMPHAGQRCAHSNLWLGHAASMLPLDQGSQSPTRTSPGMHAAAHQKARDTAQVK